MTTVATWYMLIPSYQVSINSFINSRCTLCGKQHSGMLIIKNSRIIDGIDKKGIITHYHGKARVATVEETILKNHTRHI